MRTTPSKFRITIAYLFSFIILAFPLLLIVSGSIGVATHDVFHPDTFIFFGLVLLGLITLVAVPIILTNWHRLGWSGLLSHQRILTIAYSTALILGVLIWWLVTDVLPQSWLTWLAPLG
ncbi:hypothetical protein [Levilactobacillus sp. N40-8-2]|uniref:hypothetical protein n=1 Tax=Levilactobacillus muriae TaxID=3238987 RepID=UPI0038B2CCD1